MNTSLGILDDVITLRAVSPASKAFKTFSVAISFQAGSSSPSSYEIIEKKLKYMHKCPHLLWKCNFKKLTKAAITLHPSRILYCSIVSTLTSFSWGTCYKKKALILLKTNEFFIIK